MRRIALILVLVASVVRADDAGIATQIVDALNARYGAHPGFRSNDATGIVVEGRFTPTPAAAARAFRYVSAPARVVHLRDAEAATRPRDSLIIDEAVAPSDDPLIAARDRSYAVSYERRRPRP